MELRRTSFVPIGITFFVRRPLMVRLLAQVDKISATAVSAAATVGA
jgi:hypothetical protein